MHSRNTTPAHDTDQRQQDLVPLALQWLYKKVAWELLFSLRV